MATSVESLAAEAMQLSEADREELIERLLAAQPVETLSPEWTAEIKRRMAEMDAGIGSSIPAEEVLEEMRAMIAAKR